MAKSDDYDPWFRAYRPRRGELVRFIGYGRPMTALVIEVDEQRDKVLLALATGERRSEFVSMVRPMLSRGSKPAPVRRAGAG